MADVHRIAKHIREHAVRYYPQLINARVGVKSHGGTKYSSSIIYRFTLSSGDFRRAIVAKVPELYAGPDETTRPGDPTSESRLEYEALSTMHQYFESLQDPRFGVVRPLDFLPEEPAIVMEECGEPTLRSLVSKATRLHFPARHDELEPAFANSGSWLRLYHALPATNRGPYEVESRDFIAAINRSTGFLVEALGHEPFFRHIQWQTVSEAQKKLPERLPLGLRHGDYALGNILIGPNYRVTGFDTRAKWLTPIYGDVAYFLIRLRTMKPQLLSQGLLFARAPLCHYEKTFLAGYFECGEIPYEAIRLYMIKSLLNRWAALISRIRRSRAGWHRGPRVLREVLFNRVLRRNLEALTSLQPGS